MAVTNSGMTLYTDNDTDPNWVGTNDESTEVFWQGLASEMWIVGKTAIETGTLTISADLSSAKYFTFGMLSTISPFYNTIKIQMQQDASNYEEFLLADRTTTALTYRAINGEFILGSPVLEFGQGTTTGTYSRASHTALAITVDNSTSGNIRSVENHYMDAMYYGNGRIIGGSTASDKLFTESNDLNISGDTLDCCTFEIGGVVFAMTDITITTTVGNSYGETVVFKELPNTSNIYTIDITGTADFQSSAYSAGSSNVTVNLDTSGATSWQIIGGSLVGAGTTVFKASQVVDSAVFTDRTSLTHNASLFENNTVNTSGVMTVSSTGTCTNNTFNKPSGVSAILCATLEHAPYNTYVSDGSSHAIELSSIGDGTMDWSGSTSGFDSGGAGGSPVTPTNTGNEDIYVNVASGTLTISVASGATVPSIRVQAASTVVINVVAGQVTLRVDVEDASDASVISEARVYLHKKGDTSTVYTNQECGVDGFTSDSLTFTADTDVVGWVREQSLTTPDYVAQDIAGTITSSGLTIAVKLQPI